MSHRRLVAVLLLALPLALAFAPGSQSSGEEARAKAHLLPELRKYLEKPTVETSASYYPSTDTWRVTLTEEASGSTVAYFTVEDDTGKIVDARVSPEVQTITFPALSEEEAIKIATANEKVREHLSGYGSYTTDAEYDDGEWTVHFRVEGTGSVGGIPDEEAGTKEVARVGIDDDTWVVEYAWVGDQVGWQMARGELGSYGKQANYWYVWGPMALLFALAFVRNDRLFSLRNLDVAMLLGFLVSHEYFRSGEVYEAVLLWYVPLLYLLARTLLMGFGIGERVEKTSNLPAPVLFALAALAAGFVISLNLDARVIDVGYAGVVGADRILEGTIPYGNMPDDVGTGDTYGPLNYLLYVPFVLIFGFSGEWDFLPAAHGLTIFAFAVGTVALLVAGYRLAGAKGAAALAFAWCVFPYTLYSTNNNTNDVVVAAVSAIGLAAASSPLARGASIAAGFAIKLYPLVLGPLWITHDGLRRRPVVDFLLGATGVVLMTFWALFLDNQPVEAVKLFYEKTLAFQDDRETPWTIFAQVPELSFLQRPLTALAILLAVLVAFVPRVRTTRRLAALSAAVVIAFQLTTNYWFYPYVTWFEPFVFLSLLLATNEKTPLDAPGGVPGEAEETDHTAAAQQPERAP